LIIPPIETWVHGNKDLEYQRRDERYVAASVDKTDFAQKLADITWDNAPLRLVRPKFGCVY
jgi:hypothetical protein